MRRVEWAAGRDRALVLDGVALLVAGSVSRSQVVGIWDRLAVAEVTGLGTLLEVLGEVTGAALSSLPDFAMAVLDDKGLHVAARGRCRVRVVHTDGTEVDLDGAEVSTWLERNVDAASTSHVCLGATDDAEAWLPLVGGVVPAGAVRLLVADHALPDESREAPVPVEQPAVASSVETLAEPEPEPEPELDPEPEPEPAAPRGHLAHMYTPHTVLHDIEEAAVRAAEDDDLAGSRDEAPEPVDAPTPVPAPAPTPAPVPTRQSPVSEPSPVPAPQAGPAAFISGVPSAAPARPAVQDRDPVEDGGGEHHDGHTLLEAPDSTEIDAYLASGGSSEGEGTVLGVLCPSGHANPTHRTECRVCGQRLSGEGVRMPRPGLGWLVTSAGEQIELVQNVLAGRNPQASRIQGPVLPRLLPLPHSHVSGTHLEIRLEGWSVMVADLDSTNGTFLQRPGQPTVRISRAPQLLTSDDVVQLGHGVDLRFEALP